jgi:hypothetical protein
VPPNGWQVGPGGRTGGAGRCGRRARSRPSNRTQARGSKPIDGDQGHRERRIGGPRSQQTHPAARTPNSTQKPHHSTTESGGRIPPRQPARPRPPTRRPPRAPQPPNRGTEPPQGGPGSPDPQLGGHQRSPNHRIGGPRSQQTHPAARTPNSTVARFHPVAESGIRAARRAFWRPKPPTRRRGCAAQRPNRGAEPPQGGQRDPDPQLGGHWVCYRQ